MRHSAAAALSLALFALPRPARAADAPVEKPFDANAAADALLKERLDLKGDQAARFDAARRQRDEAVVSLRSQLRAAYRKLRSQIAARSKDDELGDTLKQVSRLRKALRDEDDKFEASTTAFLSPLQRAKLAAGDPTDGAASAAAGAPPADMRDILTDGDGENE